MVYGQSTLCDGKLKKGSRKSNGVADTELSH